MTRQSLKPLPQASIFVIFNNYSKELWKTEKENYKILANRTSPITMEFEIIIQKK